MPTPPKPFTVLTSEKKSHRTKEELKQRKKGEESLSTGVALKERSEVKKNRIAHKEFKRLNELLGAIGKNDAIYETVINRYCELQSECVELKEDREFYKEMLEEIRSTFKDLTGEMNIEERAALLIDLTNSLGRITSSIEKIDGRIQGKRKMLLDIEKENIMTIAAALRSIPKKEEKSSKDKLLEALNGS